MDVRTKIMNPNFFMICYMAPTTMCKQGKHPIMLKCWSNFASKLASGMQGYSMTKNKHLMSLRAIKLRSLVHQGDLSNLLKITGHAFPQKLLYITLRIVSAGRYIDVSRTEHSTNLQMKTTCYMREVCIKLANFN